MVDHQDILLADAVVREPDRVRSILARRAREYLAGDARRENELRIVRLVLPVPAGDPFSWLHAQNLLPKIYWAGRDDGLSTAAVGTADRCYGGPEADYNELRSQLDAVLPRSDDRVRYFGGFRFDPTGERSAEWEPFGTFTFTLPRFEYLLSDDRAVLACNLLLPRDIDIRDRILQEISSIHVSTTPLNGRVPTPIARRDEPNREGWMANVNAALEAFRAGDMEKVVLARKALFGFAEPVDPIVLLRELDAATANCFSFGFQVAEDAAFVGATPERLFRRDGREIRTEAVAGTRPRGATPEEDERNVQALIMSDKDQREHAYVRESIRNALVPLCNDFHIDDEADRMKLPRSWHLVSRSTGLLREDVHGSDVMRALHPTPAVGGHPTEAALEAIGSLEPFDRGWYAGPVGWIGSHSAEFAVALRCGLVREDSLALYSGAGIVKGSNPESEWAEIEQKISDFIKVLGLEVRSGA